MLFSIRKTGTGDLMIIAMTDLAGGSVALLTQLVQLRGSSGRTVLRIEADEKNAAPGNAPVLANVMASAVGKQSLSAGSGAT
jgi:hypothetical protein